MYAEWLKPCLLRALIIYIVELEPPTSFNNNHQAQTSSKYREDGFARTIGKLKQFFGIYYYIFGWSFGCMVYISLCIQLTINIIHPMFNQ